MIKRETNPLGTPVLAIFYHEKNPKHFSVFLTNKNMLDILNTPSPP